MPFVLSFSRFQTLFGPEAMQALFGSWNFLRENRNFFLYGYVVLENHIHLIASAPGLSTVMKSFKMFKPRRTNVLSLCRPVVKDASSDNTATLRRSLGLPDAPRLPIAAHPHRCATSWLSRHVSRPLAIRRDADNAALPPRSAGAVPPTRTAALNPLCNDGIAALADCRLCTPGSA
jgi:hypothetical protein